MEEYDDIDEDDQPRVAYVDVEREGRLARYAAPAGPARDGDPVGSGADGASGGRGSHPRTARRSRADIPSGEASPGRFRGHRTTTATARSLPRSPTMTTTTSISSARPPATTVPTPRRPATTTSSPRVRPSRPHTWECVASRAEATPPPPPRPRPPTPTATFSRRRSAAAPPPRNSWRRRPRDRPREDPHAPPPRRARRGRTSRRRRRLPRGGAIESLRVHRGGVGGARPIGGVDARRLRVRARLPFRVDASARRPTDAHAAHIPIDGREDEGR